MKDRWIALWLAPSSSTKRNRWHQCVSDHVSMMSKKLIYQVHQVRSDNQWVVAFRDENFNLHRVDGPAHIYEDGSHEWQYEGKLHSYYGPALFRADKKFSWYWHGSRTSFDTWKNRVKDYIHDEYLDRAEVIAKLDKFQTRYHDNYFTKERFDEWRKGIATPDEIDGREIWTLPSGMVHREDDEPAVTFITDKHSSQRWMYYGQYHRVGAPAYIDDKCEAWYKYGMLHRDDGPAYIRDSVQFFLYDQAKTFDEWMIESTLSDKEKMLVKLKYAHRAV